MTARRRGFGLVIAVGLLAVTGAALLALTAAAAADFRRTRASREEVQLREMLRAGGISAARHVSQWSGPAPGETWELPLPPEVSAGTAPASVRLTTRVEKPVLQILIDAKIGDHRASQTLTVEDVGGKWTITAVALAP